ncbi:MAG: FMN-binding protein [Spirochaetota bacterium]
MKKTVIIGGKLTLICAIAALSLGFVNALTEPVIAAIKKIELEKALAAVSAGGKVGEGITVETKGAIKVYYPVSDIPGGKEGYIVKLTATGYGGDMTILAGFSSAGEILSVKLMDNSETPGLGKVAEKDSYMEKFIGTGGEKKIPVRKTQLSQSEADAITGATITFIGIAKALEAGSEFAKSVKR